MIPILLHYDVKNFLMKIKSSRDILMEDLIVIIHLIKKINFII